MTEIDVVTTSLPTSFDATMYTQMSATYFYTSVIGGIVSFLLVAIGLYMINKKFKEENAWVAFIPVVQIWSFFQASKKPFLEYFVYPFIALMVGAFLAPFTLGLTYLAGAIYFFVMWIKLLHAISLRTGRGVGTTIGFFLIPYIMFPYVGYTMKGKK